MKMRAHVALGRRTSLDAWGAALAATLGLSLGGCGGETTGSGSGGGTGGGGPTPLRYPCESPAPELGPNGEPLGIETCADGSSHRVEPVTCASELPRPDAVCDTGVAGGSCTTDADCTERSEGMCATDFSGTCACQYQCTTDADCGDGFICRCGTPAGRCVQATCQTDADCPGALECRSFAVYGGICGETRFECQSAGDTCSFGTCGDGCTLTPEEVHVCQDISCAVPGRPFLVGGRAVVAPRARRDDWLGAAVPRGVTQPSTEHAGTIAEHFAEAAAMEHASVAAFARFSLQLLALGAPAELVEAATAAAGDELRHARLCYRLASRFAGEAVGPGPLDVAGALADTSLSRVLEDVVREGCIGETVAALGAAEALAHAEDDEVRSALAVISEDETRHAELAWRFVAWALGRDPSLAPVASRALDEARAAAERAVKAAPTSLELGAWGVLPAAHLEAIHRDALEQVVAPLLESLVGAMASDPDGHGHGARVSRRLAGT